MDGSSAPIMVDCCCQALLTPANQRHSTIQLSVSIQSPFRIKMEMNHPMLTSVSYGMNHAVAISNTSPSSLPTCSPLMSSGHTSSSPTSPAIPSSSSCILRSTAWLTMDLQRIGNGTAGFGSALPSSFRLKVRVFRLAQHPTSTLSSETQAGVQ